METGGPTSLLLPCGFALLIVLLFGGIVALMFRQGYRRRQDLQARGLIFQPSPDAALLEGMRRLMPEKQVKDVYCLNRGAYRLYLFDLWDAHGHDSSSGTGHTVALLSPDFSLPRCALFPNLKMPAVLGGMTDWVLQQATNRFGLLRMPPGDCAPFDEAYLLLGADEGLMRSFFDRERLTRLAQLKYLQFDAQADLLIFAMLDTHPRPSDPPGGDKISSLLDTAAQLYAIFR